jgi:hypothetical protein
MALATLYHHLHAIVEVENAHTAGSALPSLPQADIPFADHPETIRPVLCIGCGAVALPDVEGRLSAVWLRADIAAGRGVCSCCYAYIRYWDRGGWNLPSSTYCPPNRVGAAPALAPIVEYRTPTGFVVCAKRQAQARRFVVHMVDAVGEGGKLLCHALPNGANRALEVEVSGAAGTVRVTLTISGKNELTLSEPICPGAQVECAVIDMLDAMYLLACLIQALEARAEHRA